MNKKNLRASAAILTITIIWMISGYFAQKDPVIYEAPIEQEIVLVNASVAQDFSLPVLVKAESQAFSKVDIRAQTSEKIVDIAYADGDFVQEGALICKLDSGQRQANFKKSKIDYKINFTKYFL
jgi:multidrug efflux pump subunit AcrA (membrane-fusion protein)